MVLKVRSAAVCFLILFAPATGFCWGDEGHEIVALIAQQILNDQAAQDATAAKTLATLKSILSETKIEEAAIWPDQVKNLARTCTQAPYIKDPAYGKEGFKGKSSAICDAYNYTASWHEINTDKMTYAIDVKAKDHFKGDVVMMLNGRQGRSSTELLNFRPRTAALR